MSELISKLSEYFYFGLFLEQSLGFKVIGKKYAVRRAIPETHENQGNIFSFHILPRSCMDLPGSGEVGSVSQGYPLIFGTFFSSKRYRIPRVPGTC